jgi:nucleotide-binding universal stress UspA family protein
MFGNVVGMVTAQLSAFAMMPSGSIPQNVNFAIRSPIITNFLSVKGVTPKISNSDTTGIQALPAAPHGAQASYRRKRGDTAMHILIPTDDSDLSNEAILYGVDLAKALNARVTGVTVSIPFHIFAVESGMIEDTRESYRKRMTTLAAQRLGKVKDAADAARLSCEVVHVENEHPYKAIIDVANTKACDLIVMASHGRRGISAIVLGSETLKVLTHSTIPVLVYRGRAGLSSPYFATS